MKNNENKVPPLLRLEEENRQYGEVMFKKVLIQKRPRWIGYSGPCCICASTYPHGVVASNVNLISP